MSPFERDWIDNASYEELLTKLRQEPIGSSWLSDTTGTYLAMKLAVKRHELSVGERTEIAKRVAYK